MIWELILRCVIVVIVMTVVAVLITFMVGAIKTIVEPQDQEAIALCICVLIPYCWYGQYEKWSKKWNVKD